MLPLVAFVDVRVHAEGFAVETQAVTQRTLTLPFYGFLVVLQCCSRFAWNVGCAIIIVSELPTNFFLFQIMLRPRPNFVRTIVRIFGVLSLWWLRIATFLR